MEFLEQFRLGFLTLHILSMALGLGGATVSDILFFKFLKDHRVSKKEEEVLHVLKNLILFAMLIIAVSGIALYLPDAEGFNSSDLFLVKAFVTVVLICNGIALHVFIAPHLMHFNLQHKAHMGRSWHRLAFALGAISVCSWYSVFLIAMLKSALSFAFAQALGAYISLLIIAIICSQIMEEFLSRKAGKTTA